MQQSIITRCCEEDQNYFNILSATNRKRFLSRKIHKIKKILKLQSKSRASDKYEYSLEERQNTVNERVDEKLNAVPPLQDIVDENWNDTPCRLCCANKENQHHRLDLLSTLSGYAEDAILPPPTMQTHSICYVFMPNQYEPVPVKLRTARIPGGVMCVSYRPDMDIRNRYNYVYSCTSFQQPQAQQALRPIMV